MVGRPQVLRRARRGGALASLIRLRLAKKRLRQQTARPTSIHNCRIGDGNGNVIAAWNPATGLPSDHRWVRDDTAGGRVMVARNPSGHAWKDGDPVLCEYIGTEAGNILTILYRERPLARQVVLARLLRTAIISSSCAVVRGPAGQVGLTHASQFPDIQQVGPPITVPASSGWHWIRPVLLGATATNTGGPGTIPLSWNIQYQVFNEEWPSGSPWFTLAATGDSAATPLGDPTASIWRRVDGRKLVEAWLPSGDVTVVFRRGVSGHGTLTADFGLDYFSQSGAFSAGVAATATVQCNWLPNRIAGV
jgi:hypothetical protein